MLGNDQQWLCAAGEKNRQRSWDCRIYSVRVTHRFSEWEDKWMLAADESGC